MGPSLVQGSYTAWNYFQSLQNPLNKQFVASFKAKYGKNSVLDDPMIHGYEDVYLWAAAAKKAGSFDPMKVRAAAMAMGWQDSPLGKVKIAENQSLYQTGYVGELQPDGQVKVLWSSNGQIRPDPYDALAFPGKSCPAK